MCVGQRRIKQLNPGFHSKIIYYEKFKNRRIVNVLFTNRDALQKKDAKRLESGWEAGM